MRRQIAAAMAALALAGFGLTAQSAAAQEKQAKEQKETKKEERAQAGMAEQKELTGKVLSVHEKTLWIEGSNGEAVPLAVSHQTKLEGQQLKKDQRVESHLRKEFKEGEEVRASFELKKGGEGRYENMAVSVDKSGTGGAGQMGTETGATGTESGAKKGAKKTGTDAGTP